MPENHGFEESQEIPEVVLKNDTALQTCSTTVQDEKIYSFDEAISLAKVGIFHYFLQTVCGMCLMTAVVEVMGISIVMPFISRDIPSTATERGLLASAGFLGVVLSSHAVGFLSDTWGRAKMLRTTLSISFITSIASVFSFNIWMLILLKFLTGFIMSACQGSVYNFVGEFHSSKTRAKYVTMLSVFGQLGMIFLPAVALVILPLNLNTTVLGLQFQSWRLLLLIFSSMRIFALIGLFVLPESPKFVFVQGDHEKTLNTLKMIYSKNTRNPVYDYPVHQIAADLRGDNLKNVCGVKGAVELIWNQTAPLFNRSRILHTLNICVMMFLLSAISHGAYMWFPTILKQQIANFGSGLTTCQIMQLPSNDSVHVSQMVETSPEVVIDTSMFKVLIVIGSVFSVTYFLFSLIINAVGKRKFLFTLILIPGLSCLVLQFMTSIPWAIVTLTIVMTLTNCVGIVGTMAFEFFPTNISGMGMSLVMMIARIGSAAGSSIIGSMIYVNCDMLFYISSALCFLLLILTILLPEVPQVVLKDNKGLSCGTSAHDDKTYSYDEAISLAKVGIFHYFLQIVCGMCFITNIVEIMGVSFVIPFISRDIPSTTAEKGLLTSAGFIGIVMSSHAVGFLSDTWGRAKMLRTTFSLSFITSIASAFSFNIWMLIVLRFLTGFGMSCSVINFVGEFHSSKTRAKYVTMLAVFPQFAMMFMPAVALGILTLNLNTTVLGLQLESWRMLMLVFSFTRTFALIGLFILPESPKYILVQGDHEEALKTLRMIYSKNTRNPGYEYPVHRIAAEVRGHNLKNVCGVKGAIVLIWNQTAPLFNKNRIFHTLNLSVTIFLISAIAHGSYMWFPTILNQQIANFGSGLTTCQIMHLASNDSVNGSEMEETSSDVVIDTAMFKILIIIGAVFSVSYFVLSLIVTAVGKRKLLFILILIPGLSSVAIQFMTSIPWAVVVSAIVMTLSNCIGIVSTMAFEFFPTNISGMGMCLFTMAARIGGAAGSSIIGSMIYVNCVMLFYIVFALCMLLLILSILLPGRR